MTKKLDDLFNIEHELPKVDDTKEVVVVDNHNAIADVKDIDQAIIELADVQVHSQEMDQIAETAMKGYEEVMELSRNVDERNAAHVLGVAAQMHKTALDALSQKAKARFKAAELLTKKKVIDMKDSLENADVVDNDTGVVSGDRNDILKMIKNDKS